jgi:vancomycin resistance protein YoaR
VRRALRWIGIVILGTSLGIGVGVGAHFTLPESPTVRGLFIGGRRVPEHTWPASWLADHESWIAERHIVLRDHDQGHERLHSFTFDELGIVVDIEQTVQAAERVGHSGSIVTRLKETQAARRGEIDVPLVFHVMTPKASEVIETLARDMESAPVDARIDLAHRSKIADVVGRKLDVEATLAGLESSSFDDGEVVDLVTEPVKARVTLQDLTAVDVEKVVSTYETTFHTWGTGAGRAVNIANAVHYIDGIVIVPDQVFSFNEHVGPRTLDRGFTFAPEIQGDELTTGVGGGTCQASTTLFGAALFGALEIVERRSHSRPSSYTKMGLDATVSFPSTDLKIKNTLPFPVMIHAFLPRSDAVRVELLGGDPIADVTYSYGVGSTEDFLRRITVKSNLPPGQRILHQKGNRGYSVTSLITIKYRGDGHSEERSFYSGYRPTPEVFWVGPGYDEKDLPPLPEHARGVEGRTGDSDTYSTM